MASVLESLPQTRTLLGTKLCINGKIGISLTHRRIVEYAPQSYLPEDLDKFFRNYSKETVGQRPILESIDGGVLLKVNQSFDTNGEADLDIQIAMPLIWPIKPTLYQVGDPEQGASFNNFLDAIDGSYCTFEGGDDASQDATFPDNPDGYIGPANCGGYAATKVIATSYGYNEQDLSEKYQRRQCAEYMKLALQGITVLYSSGDYGVAGNVGRCIDPITGNYTRTNSSSGK
jgi:tripeptidyl-peptidase-1